MLFEPVFIALNDRGVRYLVAGGVAVVLHGYVRLTADLDLVVDLAAEQATAAVEALLGLGLKRRRGMTVFTLHDPDNPMLSVDLFADLPADFEALWARAKTIDLGTTSFKIVSLDDLLDMKRRAGRPQDLLDVGELERLRGLPGGTE